MKQLPIEITNEQIGQELDIWFTNEECEALARETGFIQRSSSRLTGATGAPRLFKLAHKRWVGVAYRYLPNSASTHTVTPNELLGIKRGAGGAVIKPGTLGH